VPPRKASLRVAPVEAESRLNSLPALDLSIRVKVKFVFHTLLVTVKVTCSLYAINAHLRTHHRPSLSSIRSAWSREAPDRPSGVEPDRRSPLGVVSQFFDD
jgi:hypothetical protein